MSVLCPQIILIGLILAYVLSFTTAIEQLRDLMQYLGSSDDEADADQRAPHANMDWSTRNANYSERWREKRPSHVKSMLAQSNVATKVCSQCETNLAVVRCRDCLPCPFLCTDCDISRHSKTCVLHNRDAMSAGFFQPLAPTSFVVGKAIRSCGKLQSVSYLVTI